MTLQRLPKTITKLNVSSNPWKLDEPHYESHRNTYLLSIMADLCTISHLSMSNCGLEEMPKVIQSYLDLKVVDLSENEISEIEGSVFNQVIIVNTVHMKVSLGRSLNFV